VRQDLKRSLRDLDHRMAKLRAQARALVQQDPELQPRLALLLSMPGIG
jgi:transposase